MTRIVANYTKDAIECARARGWTREFTITELGVNGVTVDRVWAGMDAALSDEDHRGRNVPNPALPCGTYAAYRRHCRGKTTPCEPCKTAYAAYRERERARLAARRVAS